MILASVTCPVCGGIDVVKHGKASSRTENNVFCAGTGGVSASVLGRLQDEIFLDLKGLLEPFGITRFFTDDWGAHERHLDPETHVIGKRNTQQIERKDLTLRTRIKRLVRKTICFSKSTRMHEFVIGLFVNRHEFGFGVRDKGSTELKHYHLTYGIGGGPQDKQCEARGLPYINLRV